LNRRYIIVHTPRFERSFRKLRPEFQRRISEQILILEVQPRTGKPLHGHLKGLFSLRVGEYRVIYEIHEQRIILHTVGHRRAVYEI
jgi:mRNA interferase RelE/StbE